MASAKDKPQATVVKLGGAVNPKTKAKKLVRFSHLHVFRPHLNQESKKEEYSVQLWIPKENIEDKALLDAAWDEQVKAYELVDGERGPEFHCPIKDGDKLVDKKGKPKPVPGHWVVSAKTLAFNKDGSPNDPPGVVGIERDANGELIPLKSGQVKSGDWGRVSVNFRFFTEGKGGVGVYLNNLQKVVDGEPLGGGRVSAAQDFDDYDDEQPDPLG
jgi:hypothetical protein